MKAKKRIRISGKTMDRHFKAFEAVVKKAAKISPDAQEMLPILKTFKYSFALRFFNKRAIAAAKAKK